MANTHTWGGTPNVSSFTSYPNNFVYIDGIAAPTGNLAANGNRPISVYSVAAASASGPGVYSAINYLGTGNLTSGTYATSGGTFRFVVGHTTGTLTFGRNSAIAGTVFDSADGSAFSSGTLPGSMSWAGVPTKARTPSVVDGTASGSAVVSWTAPSSDGGASVSSYLVQWSTSATFATIAGSTSSTGLTSTITGLTQGTRYYFRVGARNAVAIAAGTSASWSDTVDLRVRAGGKVKVSGSYREAVWKIKIGGTYRDATVRVKVAGVYVPAL